ncbi:class I SAM-dependent methyltransferase [Virgibacillus siamensis]|uniref:class I SAM-dependent methyltransferase n=1 Tax=Virgibacillus siamensis TaxID=480071 RepID=UPI0009843522|nr:class I SAM-dependent methyltransferase [Virgibacillus siamensis]
MEQKSMTALVSAFARAYHSTQKEIKIFDDYLAKEVLTREEYEQIASHMSKGIDFFNPSFDGTEGKALQWVVDNQLSPSPLGRAAFSEKMLNNAVKIGAEQYLIFAAGYDTFAYRQPDWAANIEIFELDHPDMIADKQKRIHDMVEQRPKNLHYVAVDFTENNWQSRLFDCKALDQNKISFCSLLGISYYLSEENFKGVFQVLSEHLPKGSSVVFDYPDENTHTKKAGERAQKQTAMAGAAGEKMLSGYSYFEMEKLLSESSFLVYEHMTPDKITNQFFQRYNEANPQHQMTAFDNVNYCLAVKR